jgi:hypothetical protein
MFHAVSSTIFHLKKQRIDSLPFSTSEIPSISPQDLQGPGLKLKLQAISDFTWAPRVLKGVFFEDTFHSSLIWTTN